MRRTERVQGLRLMKFEEIYGRTRRGALAQSEAAEILGVSERTFRRWRDRYEAEGAEGLYDRRPVGARYRSACGFWPDAAINAAQSSGGFPRASILANTTYGSVLLPEDRSVRSSLIHA